MAIRNAVRWAATGAFILMLVPVVGDFFVEIARENGFYNKPTERVQAVVAWAQSLFGEQGFFWLLFALGGLVAGLWLDGVLRRQDVKLANYPYGTLADNMANLFGAMPQGMTWTDTTPSGTTWESEIASMHLQMIKESFSVPPMRLSKVRASNLTAHRAFFGELLPLVRDNLVHEAKMRSVILVARMTGQLAPDEEVPVYLMPSVVSRLLGEKPKRLSPPDTESGTQQ